MHVRSHSEVTVVTIQPGPGDTDDDVQRAARQRAIVANENTCLAAASNDGEWFWFRPTANRVDATPEQLQAETEEAAVAEVRDKARKPPVELTGQSALLS